MDLDAVKALNRSSFEGNAARRQAALERLGNPSADELVEMALEALGSPDRNVRGQMVRLLAGQSAPRAAEGMLRALSDPARRVRRLAARLSWVFGSDEAIEARLREMAEDEDETVKIRSAAFHALSSGKFLSSLGTSPGEARSYFAALPDLERHRQMALDVLVSLDPLTDAARAILRYVVETGTREEAVAATRALSGFKVMNLGSFPDPAERRRVAQTCEPARGRVFFWVPRDEA